MSLVKSNITKIKLRTFGDLKLGDTIYIHQLPVRFLKKIENGVRFNVAPHKHTITEISYNQKENSVFVRTDNTVIKPFRAKAYKDMRIYKTKNINGECYIGVYLNEQLTGPEFIEEVLILEDI